MLQNRSLSAKIGFAFLMFTVLLVACSGLSLAGLWGNERQARELIDVQGRTLFIASRAAMQGGQINQKAYALDVQSDPPKWAGMQADLEAAVAATRQTLTELETNLHDDVERTLFRTVTTSLDRYVELEKEGYPLRISNDVVNMGKFEELLQGDLTTAFAQMDGALKQLLAKQQQDMIASGATIHAAATQTFWMTAGLSAAGLLITLTCAMLLVSRQIVRPLSRLQHAMTQITAGDTAIAVPGLGRKDEVGAFARALEIFKTTAIDKLRTERDTVEARRQTEVERQRNAEAATEAAGRQASVVEAVGAGLRRLAAGDLAVRLPTPFAADYEALRHDFNGALDQLQDALGAVATTTAALRDGSTNIATAGENLSKRTEQQAAALEQTAAALDEITTTVRKTAEGASHARRVVVETSTDAGRSGDVVRRAVLAMNAIDASSQQVSRIVGVIDEIAFQTNLLALNAGVEAARAGDAGRGFAVVASEVRGLAQRSAEAAREIKSLIAAAAGHVGEGVALVGETGETLARIVGHVAAIEGIVGTIAASAQEQAAGLDEVNTAVNQMDQVTQQNAAMVEETAAATQSLMLEAADLTRLVGRFRLGEAERPAAERRHDRTAKPQRAATRRGSAAVAVAVQADDW